MNAIAVAAARDADGVLDISPPLLSDVTGDYPGCLTRRSLIDADVTLPAFQLRITARYGANLPAVANEVRRRVREAFETILGQAVERVDVVVTEVVDTRDRQMHVFRKQLLIAH